MRWSKVRNLIIQLTAGQPIMKIPICYKSMTDFQLTTCQYTRGYGYCLPKNSTLDFVWLPWWLPFPQIHFPSQVLLVPLCKCPKRQQTPPKRWSKVGKMQRQGGQWHFSWKHATKTRRKEIQKILYVGSWLRFPCLRFFYQKGKSEILKGLCYSTRTLQNPNIQIRLLTFWRGKFLQLPSVDTRFHIIYQAYCRCEKLLRSIEPALEELKGESSSLGNGASEKHRKTFWWISLWWSQIRFVCDMMWFFASYINLISIYDPSFVIWYYFDCWDWGLSFPWNPSWSSWADVIEWWILFLICG